MLTVSILSALTETGRSILIAEIIIVVVLCAVLLVLLYRIRTSNRREAAEYAKSRAEILRNDQIEPEPEKENDVKDINADTDKTDFRLTDSEDCQTEVVSNSATCAGSEKSSAANDAELGELASENENTQAVQGESCGAEELSADVAYAPYGATPSLDEVFSVALAQPGDEDDDREDNGKITFASKLRAASDQNKAIYNALKNEIMSYRGIKSRVVGGGDYFRRPGKQIIKLILIGKTMRMAIALDPKDYDYNIYHQKDRGSMVKYAGTPMFVKVQSRLGVNRAIGLISDVMAAEGMTKNKKYRPADYARLLCEEPQNEADFAQSDEEIGE